MNYVGEVINHKYKIFEKIGEGDLSTVWLAMETGTKNQVAIKILKSDVISSRVDDIIRFKNDAYKVSQADNIGVAKIFEIGEIGNLNYVVMEYFEGKSLQRLIDEGARFSVDYIVELICKIGDTLKRLNGVKVLHRDLKPSNIITNFKDGMDKEKIQVYLTDFGLAQIKEFNIKDTKRLINSLLYMSPEQGGIIKRNIDIRSDLYSLGIIFYQLLANELPFKGDNVNTLIHQHIAKTPEKLLKVNSEIPRIIEKIVFKLLEKEPEKRYQGIDGLISDLKKYNQGYNDFALGLDDKNIRLNYRTNFIGRDEELNYLIELFDNSTSKKGSLCLISGESGKGKTRLAEELKNHVYTKKSVFFSCKFSSENKVPYASLKDIFSDYVNIFSSYSESKKNVIRYKVKENIGDLGQIILNLFPEAIEILGTCPPLIELEPEKENKRFQLTLCQFLDVIGETENGLVIMLDDMQWIDNATVELLGTLVRGISNSKALVIGIYRDDELGDEHLLRRFLNAYANNKYSVNIIELKAFDFDKTNKLIASLLYDKESNTKEISELIYKKSNGNISFTIEILKNLVESDAIVHSSDKWEFDREKIQNVEIPSSIVEVLIKKISGLSDMGKYVLSYASVFGRHFDTNYLFKLVDLEKEEIVEIIDNSVSLQLLEHDAHKNGETYFIHNRIKDEFYKNMGEDIRKELHLKIARMFEQTYSSTNSSMLFELAYHYIQSGEKEKICEYAYPAGLKAKENYANRDVIDYMNIVKEILEEKGEIDSIRYIDCLQALGETYLTIGNNDHAIEILNKVLSYCDTKISKATIYDQIGKAYYKKGDFENSEIYTGKSLMNIDEKLPTKKTAVLFGMIKEIIVYYISSNLSFLNKLNKDTKNVDESKMAVRVYNSLGWTYMLTDGIKFIRSVFRILNILEQKVGKSSELAIGYTGYAAILMSIPFFEEAGVYYQKAINLSKDIDDMLMLAQATQFLGYNYEWSGEYEKSMELFKNSAEMHKQIGDIKEYNMSLNGYLHGYYYMGYYQKMKEINDLFYENAAKSKDLYAMCASTIYSNHYYREIGDLEKSESCGLEAINLSLDSKDWFNYCSANVEMGITYIYLEEADKAIEHLERAKKLNESNNFLRQYVILLYPYLAESYILKYEKDRDKLSKIEKKILLRTIKKSCNIAIRKTRKWPTYYGISLRVNARYYSIIGKNLDAENAYAQSIKHSLIYKRRYEQARSIFEYAEFLKKNSRNDEARENFEVAYNIFKDIGSNLFKERAASYLGVTESAAGSNSRFLKELRHSQRFSSIVSLSQGISSILDVELLMEKIMTITLEVSGAQNGYIIMKDDKTDELNIVARKNIEDDYKSETEWISEISKNIVKEVFTKGKAIIVINAMEDDRFKNFQSVVVNEIKSVLCLPIKYNNELKGVCYLDNPLSSAVFTEDDIDVLNVVLSQAAISLENAKLFKMAITDGLTGLITHKHFIYLLQKELNRARRYTREFSLIMFDIDHFKKFNDTYGHQAGDKVLINVAKLIIELFRNADLIARYGGEEFAIMLPETGIEGAMISAERLRKSIEEMEVLYEEQRLNVTVSVGVATFPLHADNENSLIKAADLALYLSKGNGRNKVTAYQNQF